MKRMDGYMAGVNLGGWLSQYEGNLRRDPEHHFDRFITKEDIDRIAAFGFDHVRVPFDYPLIEDDDKPFVYKESGFAYLDNCVTWCKAAGINLILDLHRAPGFSFNEPEKSILFGDADMQARFLAIWKAFAKRYRDEKHMLFELLNEIVEPDSTRWNALASRGIAAIREVDKEHAIVIGGIDYNNVWRLRDMPIFDDSKIIYNFHMYEPFAMTHQHASWNPDVVRFNRDVHYPAPLDDYLEFARETGRRMDIYEGLTYMDRDFVFRFLQPAADFIAEHDLPLYCGEYGVIDEADLESRAAWTQDVAAFCTQYGIGRALWSYRGMNFGLVDEVTKQPVSAALLRAAVRK
ncbi:MAG: glycoside hydrolase family 5 protein [Candidatus Spyradocola sp.]|jgi:endoglucanase